MEGWGLAESGSQVYSSSRAIRWKCERQTPTDLGFPSLPILDTFPLPDSPPPTLSLFSLSLSSFQKIKVKVMMQWETTVVR